MTFMDSELGEEVLEAEFYFPPKVEIIFARHLTPNKSQTGGLGGCYRSMLFYSLSVCLAILLSPSWWLPGRRCLLTILYQTVHDCHKIINMYDVVTFVLILYIIFSDLSM